MVHFILSENVIPKYGSIFVELLYYLCEDGIEKFCLPPDHHLSSFGKPRDAYR